MSWFVFALLATLMLTLINFGDKFVVESQVKHPFAVLIYMGVVNLILGSLLWILSGFQVFSLAQTLPLVIAGMLTTGGAYFYFQAVMQEETSRVIILLQLQPLFVLVFSLLFFNQRLSLLQFIGFALILVATIAISLQGTSETPNEVKPRWSAASRLMVLATFIWSIGILLPDPVLDQLILVSDPVTEETVVNFSTLMGTIAMSSFGYVLASILLLLFSPPVRQAVQEQRRVTTLRNVIPIVGVESIFVARQFVFYMALALGTPALISVVGSTSVFFGILFGWGLTLWRPHVFKEDMSRNSLLQKILWAGVAFVGLLLVQ